MVLKMKNKIGICKAGECHQLLVFIYEMGKCYNVISLVKVFEGSFLFEKEVFFNPLILVSMTERNIYLIVNVLNFIVYPNQVSYQAWILPISAGITSTTLMMTMTVFLTSRMMMMTGTG